MPPSSSRRRCGFSAWYGSHETCLSSPAVHHFSNQIAWNPKKIPRAIDLRHLIDYHYLCLMHRRGQVNTAGVRCQQAARTGRWYRRDPVNQW